MFYSDYSNLIISTSDKNKNTYFTNADKAGIFGIEMAAEYLFSPGLSAGMTYSYMDWDTRGSSADYITFTPKHSRFGLSGLFADGTRFHHPGTLRDRPLLFEFQHRR